jgi:hypothetical protein
MMVYDREHVVGGRTTGSGSVFHCDIRPGGAKLLPTGAAELSEAELIDLARSALAWEWRLGVAGIRDGVLWMRSFLIPWYRSEARVADVRRVVLYQAPGPMAHLTRLGARLRRRVTLTVVVYSLIFAALGLLHGKPWPEALLHAAGGGVFLGLLFGGLPNLVHAWEYSDGISLFAFQVRTDGGQERLMALGVKRGNEAKVLACLSPVFEIERVPTLSRE